MINFNELNPENHTYCVSSLNGTHANVLDNNTNKIIKKEKTEVFDKILTRSLGNLETLSTNSKVPEKVKANGKDALERIKKTVVFNKNGMKKYYSELNTLSYNNKDMVLETWNGLECKPQQNPNIIEENNKEQADTNSNSDFTESSDSDSDLDDDGQLKSHKYNKLQQHEEQVDFVETTTTITIGQKKYILEGTNVFTISNNKKGELYGTFSNGKVKKIINKDIEV